MSDRKLATTLNPGTILADKYVIETKLGGGGMGQVFRASQRPIDRQVAIKLLHPKYVADQQVQERFLREAQTASQLRHPYTITIYDFGQTDDDLYFIVMEFVDGESLAELAKREGPLPLERVGPIIVQIAQSLGEAHRKGIIHRDLKPDNVMVSTSSDGNDRIKVLDFGIAKLVDQSKSIGLTQTGSVFGTPGYMSPEQARGDDVDPSADFYALTCALYECLTGELPYKGGSALETMMKHQSEEIPRLGPDYPDALDQFLARGMAKDPRQRLASADDYIAAFMGCFVDRNELPDSVSGEVAVDSQEFSAPQTPGSPVDSAEQRATTRADTSEDRRSDTRSGSIPDLSGDTPTREADSLDPQSQDIAFETTASQRQTPTPGSDDGSQSNQTASQPRRATTSSDRNDSSVESGSTTAHSSAHSGVPAESETSSHTSRHSHASTITRAAPVMMILGVVALLGVGIAVGSLLSSPASNQDDSASTATEAATSELLKIASQPDGATVIIDEERLGTTPLNASVPADEPFDVTLQKPGFQTESFEGVQFDNQTNERLFADLSRKTLQIRVTSPVDGAALTVNGTSFGQLPAGRTRDVEVAWPKERLTLRLDPPNYEPFVENIPASALESPLVVEPAEADLVPSPESEDSP